MKGYFKNYFFVRTGMVILLVSFVINASPAPLGRDVRKVEPNVPAAVVQTSIARTIVPGNVLVRPRPEPSTASLAQSPDSSDDLSIDATLDDQHFVLRRRHRPRIGHLVVIQIIAVLVGKPAPGDEGQHVIDLNATITGSDAVNGSLLYSLAWLAGNSDPLGSVRALGYDIDAFKQEDRPCVEKFSGLTCVERAQRLATLLDATLLLGSPEERSLFRKGAEALGVGPDCVAGTTPVTSPSVNAASPDAADLSIAASVGDEEVVFERRAGSDRGVYLVVKFKEVFITSVHPAGSSQMIDLGSMIEGVDAERGSLPYALAWLAGFADPLGAVRGLGYDITVSNQHVHSCSDQRRGYTCEDRAHDLATLIDAALGFASPVERAAFRRDAAGIGIAPDCSLREP